MIFVYYFIMAFFATMFFSLIMNIPKRVLIITSFIGSIGYMIYYFIQDYNIIIASIISMVFIAISGEVFAVFYKTPSLDIVFPAVIPLVPGIGLYKSMLYLIEHDFTLFYRYACETVGVAIIIAVTIALIKSLFRLIPKGK